MPSSARCRSPINHRPAAAKREAAQCDDHPDALRTIHHGTAVSTSQKTIACPKAIQNRRLHRYANPRTARRHEGAGARLSDFFSWTVHCAAVGGFAAYGCSVPLRVRPVLFLSRTKREWGVHCPAIIIADSSVQWDAPPPKKGSRGTSPLVSLTASPAPAAPAPCRAGPTG